MCRLKGNEHKKRQSSERERGNRRKQRTDRAKNNGKNGKSASLNNERNIFDTSLNHQSPQHLFQQIFFCWGDQLSVPSLPTSIPTLFSIPTQKAKLLTIAEGRDSQLFLNMFINQPDLWRSHHPSAIARLLHFRPSPSSPVPGWLGVKH